MFPYAAGTISICDVIIERCCCEGELAAIARAANFTVDTSQLPIDSGLVRLDSVLATQSPHVAILSFHRP
jgi:hypothetical protein